MYGSLVWLKAVKPVGANAEVIGEDKYAAGVF
jgi:hypothetical protein